MLELNIQTLLQHQLPIKLHLGCGPNLYDGWVNVDGDYCAGQPGVIIHNITDPYPIPDNCVDEILSVHVIEHIEHWKIRAMLTEWHRILCPGGQVAVEWPDLLKACTFIVENPDSLISDDRRVLKKTINSIFGNAKYQNRAMMHAYGYSVASMSRLFTETGFSVVRSENNLYAKTASDSRVIGIK